MELLKNKKAFVTGGATGIGRSIVECFLQQGAEVIFTYRSSENDALQLINEYREQGCSVSGYSMDVTNPEQIRQVVQKAAGEEGKIEILVNNAGMIKDSYLMMMDEYSWANVIQTDLSSIYYICKATLPYMLGNTASIINISSIAGILGAAGQTNYAAAKAGVIGLTKSLAKEVARQKIRVNAIAPGYIETKMLSGIQEKKAESYRQQIPLKRFGHPTEIGNAAVFLASELASYVTGQVLVVDGGVS